MTNKVPNKCCKNTVKSGKYMQSTTTGKCFTCKQSGHLSCNCPRHVLQNNPRASTSKVKEEEQGPPPAQVKTSKFSANDIIEIMRNADDKDKDKVIQNMFMVQGF